MTELGRKLAAGAALARSVLTPFERPDRLPRAIAAMAPWGQSIAGLVAGAAARYPDRTAIIDDAGATTYRELWARTRSIAAGLRDRGVGTGTVVGILARNHRGFVEWLAAAAATGADLVLLNTGFAGPQLADVVVHERITVLLHDDEFAPIVGESGVGLALGEATLDTMACAGHSVEPNKSQGMVVILTSGTTGRPKGAARRSDDGRLEGIAAVLDRIPLRLGDTQIVAAPLFHAWGSSHLLLGLSRCATQVLARRFDPAAALAAVATTRADVLVVVPVMLERILAVPDHERFDTSSLRVIAASGSAIRPTAVTSVLDRFGPTLYNLYGSTEVAVATIATPDDLRRDPSTAGRVAMGVRVAILDGDGRPVPEGQRGRIFVGGAMSFDGYTNGGDKERVDGLLSTGDMGYLRDGQLTVDGREDDMIVSGGENVFPAEVEDLLAAHPAVADVAIVGVPDDEFGQALAAFVVPRSGTELTAESVRDHVRAQLARHKIPRQVHFLDELPRTTTGKVLRRQLTDPGIA